MTRGGDEPRFFLDRGLGSKLLPKALREAGWLLETMDERYGCRLSQQQRDVDWIAEAARRGDVSVCKDTAIASDPEEARTVYMHSARIFAFSNKNLTSDTMAELLCRWQSEIWGLARRVDGPYVYAISNNRPRRCMLRYP